MADYFDSNEIVDVKFNLSRKQRIECFDKNYVKLYAKMCECTQSAVVRTKSG